MATLLTKPVTRECLGRTAQGTLMVTLEPGDMLVFRRKGKRTRYEVSLHNCEVLAWMQDANARFQAKVAAWEANGKRGRKPRRPNLGIYSPHLRAALSAKR